MHESNYGKYKVPSKLLDLLELSEQLKAQDLLLYGDLLGLYFSLEPVEMRYLNTPIDVIPFARTGADGIHIGFLTDFGQVESLEEAYIVRVEPMNFDAPVKLVARNLADFVALMCQHLYAVDVLDTSSSEVAIANYLATSSDFMLEQQEVLVACNEKLQPARIDSLTDYFTELIDARVAQVVVQTDDGIGVIKADSNALLHQEAFALERDMRPDLMVVQNYFATAPLEYKLAFVRDAQSYGILFNEPLLKGWLVEELQRLGFETEAVRLEFS